MTTSDAGSFVIEAGTPHGVVVRATQAQWARIAELKHPIMATRLAAVVETLRAADVVRRSGKDPAVHLYHRREPGTPYHVCAVVRHLNGDGVLITCHRTDRIKEGEPV